MKPKRRLIWELILCYFIDLFYVRDKLDFLNLKIWIVVDFFHESLLWTYLCIFIFFQLVHWFILTLTRSTKLSIFKH